MKCQIFIIARCNLVLLVFLSLAWPHQYRSSSALASWFTPSNYFSFGPSLLLLSAFAQEILLKRIVFVGAYNLATHRSLFNWIVVTISGCLYKVCSLWLYRQIFVVLVNKASLLFLHIETTGKKLGLSIFLSFSRSKFFTSKSIRHTRCVPK